MKVRLWQKVQRPVPSPGTYEEGPRSRHVHHSSNLEKLLQSGKESDGSGGPLTPWSWVCLGLFSCVIEQSAWPTFLVGPQVSYTMII